MSSSTPFAQSSLQNFLGVCIYSNSLLAAVKNALLKASQYKIYSSESHLQPQINALCFTKVAVIAN